MPRWALLVLFGLRYELDFDTHTADIILFPGDACNSLESIERQGETFPVAEIRAARLSSGVKVLMIPASIKSITARSSRDAANRRRLSFNREASLRTLCGFERSNLKTVEVPPVTESVSEDAFAGSVSLTSELAAEL
jgi:hypothetical protein